MAKTPLDILSLTWSKQADHLQSLSRRDLDILWYELQEEREAFDRLYLAVFSVLRDLYEAEARAREESKENGYPILTLFHAKNRA